MPDVMQIIWGLNICLLSWILQQYFKLRKEINDLRVSLAKNYATNEALEKLIITQEKTLEVIQSIKIDQATMFERIERYHDNEVREKRKALSAQLTK